MPTILVTGATGFIGGHLASRLVEQGHSVRCLVRPSAKAILPLGTHPVVGDLSDLGQLTEAVRGVDLVYHLAGSTRAFDFRHFVRTNVEGTNNLAVACARQANSPVFVMVSSLAAMGPAREGKPLCRDDRCAPVSNYGRSKYLAERALARLAHKIPVSIVRPGVVFGPRDRGMLPMFQSVARFGIHAIPGSIAPRIALLYVDDLLAILERIASRGARIAPRDQDAVVSPNDTGYYLVAADPQPDMLELGRWLAQAVNRKRCFSVHVPGILPWLVAAAAEAVGRLQREPPPLNFDKIREATSGNWTASTVALERELGFTTRRPLVEQLQTTANWYRQYGWL